MADRSRSPKKPLAEAAQDDAPLCIESGHSAWDLFEDPILKTGYTYDDLILLPGQITFGVHDVELESHFSRNIKLKTPLVSSPMDTVTESKMAIALALHGGIGVIHKYMTIEAQVKQVVAVKKYKSGFITDPRCVKPSISVAELEELRKSCGFTGFPVTEDGHLGSKLLGLVTKRDTDFIEDAKSTAVSSVMTPLKDLTVAQEGVELVEAFDVIAKSKKGKLPILKDGNIVALVAHTDLKKRDDFPLATKSDNKTLRVAAAIGTHETEKQRVEKLVEAGVDALVIDQKQGDTSQQHAMIKWIKQTYKDVDVVGGNIVTKRQAKNLIDCGVDGLRVGMGVGSVSRAQEVGACGRAQASAVYNVSRVASRFGIPVIADGGIGNPGHIIKCLCMGGNAAMCGSLLAGSEESPGEYFFSEGGRRLKSIRGTRSIEAMIDLSGMGRPKRSSRDVMVAQGVTGTVQDKGSMMAYLPYLIQSMKHGMQDIGVSSISSLHSKLSSHQLRFEIRSAAAQREGGVHDLHSFEQTLFK